MVVDVAVCSNTQLFTPLLRLPPTKTHTHQMTWPRPAQTLAKTITWTKSFSQALQFIKTLLHLWAWRETWMRRRMQINMQVPGMWKLTNIVEPYNNLSYSLTSASQRPTEVCMCVCVCVCVGWEQSTWTNTHRVCSVGGSVTEWGQLLGQQTDTQRNRDFCEVNTNKILQMWRWEIEVLCWHIIKW